MMEQATKATSEKEKSKRDFLLQKQILKSKTKSQPVKQTVIEKKPTELSEDTKFNVSIKTMISVAVGIATVVGFYYVLKSDIVKAKALPAPGVGSYPSLDLRDPSVAWPPSKHQYNDQYDNLIDAITDMEEEIEDLNDKGWMYYTIFPNDNPNQLELFDTIDFQTKDRFGREMTDYAKMIYKGQAG